MYCPKCGNQCPANYNFCPICGEKINHDPSANNSDVEWEHCQIEADWVSANLGLKYECFYWADANNERGRFTAGKSPKYKILGPARIGGVLGVRPPTGETGGDRKQSDAAFNILVNTLVKQGWEVLPEKGASVWNVRFKRKVRRSG